MKWTIRLGFAFVLVFLGLTVRAPRAAQATNHRFAATDRFVPGEVIVAFQQAFDLSAAERAIRDVGGVSARRSAHGGHYLVTLVEGVSVPDAVQRFRSMREVEYAEPNGIVHAFLTPNDPFFRNQWNFKLIGAERMWDIQKGDPSVAVAVIDTGVAYEDFGPYRKAPDWGTVRFLPGFDFVNNDAHANDDEGHGTHVASTIAEATDNGEGVAGLAYRCSLMPVKALDEEGRGSLFDVAAAIDYAVNFTEGGTKPVKVISLSLGGDDPSETLRRAIDRAVQAGVVVVAAAGNDSRGTVSYPAAYDNVIAVGSVDGRKQKAPYSNFGTALDVVAPGGDTTRDDDKDGFSDGVGQQTLDSRFVALGRYDVFSYALLQGTSQATPHVSALAALLVRQGITDPAAVKAAIEQTAEDLGAPGRDDTFGWGLIRPSVALSGLGLNH